MTKVKVRYTRGGSSQLPKLRKAMNRPVDVQESLAAVIAEMNCFEQRYGITTVEFFARFKAGFMGDSRDFIRWAGAFDDYQHLIARSSPQNNEAA